MRTIWKFSKPLREVNDLVSFEIPEGARVLSVVNQYEGLTIYAEVDDDAVKVERWFRVAGTGHSLAELPDDAVFVGTAVFMDGRLVFHVYDLGEQ